MLQPGAIHYDIAAVVIMTVTLLSLILRRITSGPTSRIYLSVMSLVLVTAFALLGSEFADLYSSTHAATAGAVGSGDPPSARDALMLVYFALHCLFAPAYLVLIATVSDTTHRLNDNNFTRVSLWVPMIAAVLIVSTNPFHHLVYHYVDGVSQHGPLVPLLYAIAIYYSAVGVAWLVRWRSVLNEAEFATLLILYPVIFFSAFIQYTYPDQHIEMFMTSVGIMLISAFVIRPEKRLDSLVYAGSLQAYREMSWRTFVTGKARCFVYLEIVNLERLRDLVGKNELQNVVNRMAETLMRTLESNDSLYYLRNGMFCIVPQNKDADRALRIAQKTHEEGKARSIERQESRSVTEMRTCIVRVPEDVRNARTLDAFTRRFAHLVPKSGVVTFSELAEREGFALEIALSDIVARAIELRSFEVHYQPIWCVRDGRFHSAEALVRLKDPDFGWISPGMFIPESEQNGSILEIGSILFEKICKLLGEIDYEATGIEYVEVNLSVEQCIQPSIPAELTAIARKYGVDPSRINLEITETSSSFSQAIMEANMKALSDAGFAFSLDDYGTGYSNTIRALNLPLSLVKLDKTFADGMDDPSMRTVLAETVSMMKEIGKEILVEGVETEEQAVALSAMGVDYIQGYYYSKPLPESEFVSFMIEHNNPE